MEQPDWRPRKRAPARGPVGRVMVAGRDGAHRRRIVAGLKGADYGVSESRGLHLLAALNERDSLPVDFLILDISHRPLVALSLLRAIRCESWDLPVFLLCSKLSRQLVSEAQRADVQAVLPRRVTCHELRALIDNHIKEMACAG